MMLITVKTMTTKMRTKTSAMLNLIWIVSLACFVCATEIAASLPSDVIEQIERNRADIQRIKDFILRGDGKNNSYTRLSYVTDKFGPRMSGSKNLEDALDHIVKIMKEDRLDVYEEDVMVPNWQMVKGDAFLISDFRNKTIAIAPLGFSVSGKVTADVVVVRSFEELERRKDEVRGKIVVYNQPCPSYSPCVIYRGMGASRASSFGAVASLIRSATQYSIYSVHTGVMQYAPNVTKIPAACITSEDADFIQRLVDRGIQVKVQLEIETTESQRVRSRNIVAEIKGSQFPEQVIIFGGHTDSWYNTDGAMDDGGGMIIAWEALRVIKHLNLRPRRTLRVVLWTSEENGLIGGEAYYERHKEESGNVSLIMESDHGVFKPRGLQFTGSVRARDILKKILDSFLTEISATEMAPNGESSDTAWWIQERGVPGCELFSFNERYFDFHHTAGDTMSVLNADHLDEATTLWATVVYVVSNLDRILPRTDSSAGYRNNFEMHQYFTAFVALGVVLIYVVD